MDLIDTKLSEKFEAAFLEIKNAQKVDRFDLNEKITEAKLEIRAVDTKIFESVRVIEFHKL